MIGRTKKSIDFLHILNARVEVIFFFFFFFGLIEIKREPVKAEVISTSFFSKVMSSLEKSYSYHQMFNYSISHDNFIKINDELMLKII